MADSKISDLTAVTDVLATDEFVLARSGATKKIDGTDLAAAIGASGAEIAYAQVTSPVTITSSTEATPTDIVSLGSVTYEAVPTLIEFFTPHVSAGTVDAAIIFCLWDGATMLCRIGDIRTDMTNANPGCSVFGSIKITPSAGAHTYSVKGVKTAAATAVDVQAGTGTGGVGTYAPIYMRASYADSGSGSGVSVTPIEGWVEAGETWTYASADDPTYVFTIAGVDRTARYSPGTRIKLTQATGGTKYFIVTKVDFSTDTTVTMYGGTDYDLVSEAITSPSYSHLSGPEGFPLDPSKWTVELRDTIVRTQASPTVATWYNLGSLSITIPIGVWDVDYQVTPYTNDASTGTWDILATLSTANNSQSDADWTTRIYANSIGELLISQFRQKVISLATKTTYYLNAQAQQAGVDAISWYAASSPTIVRARCAYLGSGGGSSFTDSAWTAYTPTWTASGTNPAIGNGTFQAAYKQVGKTLFLRVNLSMGSTTTYGTGAWRISLPAGLTAMAPVQPFLVTGTDAGTAYKQGVGRAENSQAYVTFINTADGNNWGPTVPHVWATSDDLQFNVVLEVG